MGTTNLYPHQGNDGREYDITIPELLILQVLAELPQRAKVVLEYDANGRVLKRRYPVLRDMDELATDVARRLWKTVLRRVAPYDLVCETARDDHVYDDVWEIPPVLQLYSMGVDLVVEENHV